MFNYKQAMKLYLADLRTNGMSEKTLETYGSILGYYATFCSEEQ